jgi:hypothetical protein
MLIKSLLKYKIQSKILLLQLSNINNYYNHLFKMNLMKLNMKLNNIIKINNKILQIIIKRKMKCCYIFKIKVKKNQDCISKFLIKILNNIK